MKKVKKKHEQELPADETRERSASGPDGGAPEEGAAAAAGEDAGAEPVVSGEPVQLTAEEELAAAHADLVDAEERVLRTLAEFDNFRRRSAREMAAAEARGVANVVTDLLDVVDNFDRALEHAGEDVPAAFLEGMRMVAEGLRAALDKRGVSRMQTEGERFDPERHEALTSQPSADVAPNTVLQEIQAGYVMEDRVLRPAKVIVAAAAPAPN